jgi:hypothetical protein
MDFAGAEERHFQKFNSTCFREYNYRGVPVSKRELKTITFSCILFSDMYKSKSIFSEFNTINTAALHYSQVHNFLR